MVTATDAPATRISSGSSTTSRSEFSRRTVPFQHSVVISRMELTSSVTPFRRSACRRQERSKYCPYARNGGQCRLAAAGCSHEDVGAPGAHQARRMEQGSPFEGGAPGRAHPEEILDAPRSLLIVPLCQRDCPLRVRQGYPAGEPIGTD